TRFFSQERRLLESYAAHAAAALETAAALDTARRRDRTARTLLDLSHSLADIGSREQVAERIVQAVRKIVDCDQAGVWLWDDIDQTIFCGAADGMSKDAFASFAALRVSPTDTPVLADLLARPRPTFVSSASAGPFIRTLLDLSGLVHLAVVPMVAGGDFYGAVVAGVEDNANRLGGDDDVVERLTGVALHGATALRNASLVDQIRHQALHDELTGLPNQRLLDDRVHEALKQAEREGGRVGLLFIDLDGFKQVNDTRGHAAGDEILRQVGQRLRATLRESDTLARLGGDEFAVLLPRAATADSAATVASKIAAALETPFVVDGVPVMIGASVGVAIYPDAGLTFSALLKAADAAMYASKTHRTTATPVPARTSAV
ncbi:MAG: diguanylate cyclase domain-containing protein, partial [Actinomycetota bacterium]